MAAQFMLSGVFAQFIRGPINSPAPGVLNGVYIPANIPTKKVVPYEYVREADVMWSKRVWSVIDLRQKFNHPLYYPMDDIQSNIWNRNLSTWSLWTIIRYHVLNGDLTLYSPFHPEWEVWKDGDAFKYPIKSQQFGGNFYNDSVFRERLFMYLGTEIIDPFATSFVSQLDPTQDSLIRDGNGGWTAVYPPNDTAWFMSQVICSFSMIVFSNSFMTLFKLDWYSFSIAFFSVETV